MSAPRPIARWTAAGLFTLPLYAVLLIIGTWTAQPDQLTEPDGWARYVASTPYLVTHLAANVIGPALVLLGTFSLTVLTIHRAPRLASAGLVLSTVGQILLTVPGVISSFATPAIAEAYLRGNRDVLGLEFSGAMIVITMMAVLSTVIGNVVLGIAVARTGVLPRWTGIVWATGAVVFYLLGAALGMATTGASLPTQPIGAASLAVSGAAMAWHNAHRLAQSVAVVGPTVRAATSRS